MRAECIGAIEELAISDPRVVVVASDPAAGFMSQLGAKHPERLLIEGVCEQAVIGMSAGLANEGFYPFVIMLAVFATRRCYEQLLLDFGLHGLSGCIVGAGGGLTYAPLGPTHLAVDDFLLTGAIPGSAVLAPGEAREAVALVRSARNYKGLSYLRLSGSTESLRAPPIEIVLGKARDISISEAPSSLLFVSCGAATLAVEDAITQLKAAGIDAGALHLHTIKPLDVDLLRRRAKHAGAILCVEEHRRIGGLSSAVLDALATADPPLIPRRFARIGVDDAFPSGYGSYEDLMESYGVTGPLLAERARSLLTKA